MTQAAAVIFFALGLVFFVLTLLIHYRSRLTDALRDILRKPSQAVRPVPQEPASQWVLVPPVQAPVRKAGGPRTQGLTSVDNPLTFFWKGYPVEMVTVDTDIDIFGNVHNRSHYFHDDTGVRHPCPEEAAAYVVNALRKAGHPDFQQMDKYFDHLLEPEQITPEETAPPKPMRAVSRKKVLGDIHD